MQYLDGEIYPYWNMKYSVFLTIIMSFVGLSASGAQQSGYASRLLAGLGKSIGYTPVDSLPEGTYDAGMAFGMPVIAEYDNMHTVTHLGFRLFDDNMKREYVSDVYNFLERYFLEMYCWKNGQTLRQKLHDDKVMFTEGSIADIKRIDEKTVFTISNVEDKFYEVTWADSVGTFLSIAFPIQYELILGMPLVEIEQNLYSLITSAPKADTCDSLPEVELMGDEIYQTVPRQTYYIESLSTSRYYYKTNGTQTLILDTLHAGLSAMNIFHEITRCNNPMIVEQNLYGFKRRKFLITLHQWLNYCKEQKLIVYTAIEEEYTDGLKLLVVVQSKSLGYNHMLSVKVPRDFIDSPTAELEASVNAFIPTHNIKNLYQKYTKSTNKKIW